MAVAERERVGYTWRGVLRAGVRGAVAFAFAYAVGVALRYTAAPVLRDFQWLDRVPDFRTIGLLSAPVALVVFGLSVRGGRSVVAEGAAADLPRGTRALAIARSNLGAAARGSARGPEAEPVQRWDRNLLAGDDRLPVAQDVT